MDFGVFVATPAYDGRVVKQFEVSIKDSMQALADAGIPATFETWCGCCYLPIARNKLVQKFLASGMSDMIFIDSDMEWQPEALLSLLQWPVDMVAGAYRVKEYEERYPVWLAPDAYDARGMSGLIRAWGVPTGFLRITRRLFDQMSAHFGEDLEIDQFDPYTGDKDGGYLNYFDTGKIGRQWYGEDIAFCRRVAFDMQRDIWIDPDIRLTHWGQYPSGHPRRFESDYGSYLRRMPGGAEDPGYQGNDIPGYLMKKEAQWLFEQAQRMDSVVEIGTFAGRSAHALLSGCSGPVFCIDPWTSMDWWDSQLDIGISDDQEKADYRYKRFLEETGNFPNRGVLRGTSLEGVQSFADKGVDMVWIDGDHSRDAVEADIEAWLPKARRLICGHDYEEWGWPAVKQAVDERFGDQVETVWGTGIWYVNLP